MYTLPNGIRLWYETLDQTRRRRGAMMDSMGVRALESPWNKILERPGMRLRHYGSRSANGPVALIIPAPIKRPYIWDLSPGRSVVRHALAHGLQVYLIEWTDPAGESTAYGLEQYADTLIDRCIGAIRTHHRRGRKVFLLSHSLGGVFATIYAALHAERVAGLVSVEAPLHFADASGSFTPLVSFGPHAISIARWFDTIPGSLLSQVSIAASPTSFCAERYADFVNSLESLNTLEGHLLVQRWTMDEASMARPLFEEVVDHLYREDRFMRGQLTIHGRQLGPSDVVSPLLAVYDPRSLIIPPASIIDFQEAAASRIKRVLPYHGDIGVGLAHVGALIGRNAHERLWPEIFDWIGTVDAMH
ncbi:MAG TPA: alpha/beta fold hydrolase [Noviherbaspirillum sp.]